MKASYFKPRKLFSFSAHPYDVGTPASPWKSYEDSHFLLKIYKLNEQQFPEYYNYHLSYTLENKIGSEEDFFMHVWQIVTTRIRYYENKDPFSRNHATHVQNIQKLRQFQNYLSSIDQWNARPSHIVIAEKDEQIMKLKNEIERMQSRLDELDKYEVAQKVMIDDEHLPTMIDLVKQMRELKLPSGRLLLRCDKKSPYFKMVAKYFSHGGKDISPETARNYFVDKKGDIPVKGTVIKPKHLLFKIVPVKTG